MAAHSASNTASGALDLTMGASDTNSTAKILTPRPEKSPDAPHANTEVITGLSPEIFQAEYPWHQALAPVFVAVSAAETLKIQRAGEAFFTECIQLTKSRKFEELLLVASYGYQTSGRHDFSREFERLRRAAIKSDIRVARRATRIDPDTGARRLDPPAFDYSNLDLAEFLPLFLGDSARVRAVLSAELAERSSDLSRVQLKSILHALCMQSFNAYREFRASGTGARAYRWSTWDTQLFTLAMADSRAAHLLISRWVLEKCIQADFSPHLHIACYEYLIQHPGPDFSLIPGDNAEKMVTVLLSRFYESARGLEIYMNRDDILTENEPLIGNITEQAVNKRDVEAARRELVAGQQGADKSQEDLRLYVCLVLSQCDFLRVNIDMLGEHHRQLIRQNAQTISPLIQWLSVQVLRGP